MFLSHIDFSLSLSFSLKSNEKMSFDEDKKESYDIYIKWTITCPLKKNKILPFATAWMDLEGIRLSEIRQSEKDKCHMISHIYGI